MSNIFRRWKRLSDGEENVDEAALQDDQWDADEDEEGPQRVSDSIRNHPPAHHYVPTTGRISDPSANRPLPSSSSLHGSPEWRAAEGLAAAAANGLHGRLGAGESFGLTGPYRNEAAFPRMSPAVGEANRYTPSPSHTSKTSKRSVPPHAVQAAAMVPAAPAPADLQPRPNESDQEYAERLQRIFDEEARRERQKRVEMDAQFAASLAAHSH